MSWKSHRYKMGRSSCADFDLTCLDEIKHTMILACVADDFQKSKKMSYLQKS